MCGKIYDILHYNLQRYEYYLNKLSLICKKILIPNKIELFVLVFTQIKRRQERRLLQRAASGFAACCIGLRRQERFQTQAGASETKTYTPDLQKCTHLVFHYINLRNLSIHLLPRQSR